PHTFLAGSCFAAALHDQALVEYYLNQSGMLGVQSKRGCPHRCSYCSYNHLEGGALRSRDSRLMVEEIRQLQTDFGVGTIFFTDAIFNDRDKLYLQLVEEMLRQSLAIRWSAFFRPQSLPRQELSLLKRAGLYALEFGTDATSDTTLAGLDKDFTFADVAAVNRDCIAEELPCAHYVIFGGPGESDTSIEEGLVNLEALGHCMVFAFSGIRLLPGTTLLRRACTERVVAADVDLLHPVYYFSPTVEREAMNRRIEQAFRGRRNRIFPPERGLAKLAVLRRFGQRGLLWDRLLAPDQSAGTATCSLPQPAASMS
ncbi:MAG: lipid biosynthesis B12-binding/radical SAM protein, partial [Desulfuromonadales bacterium]